MSRKSLAKTYSDFVMECFCAYRRAHPGPVRMEDAVRWSLDHGFLDRPKVDPIRWFTRIFKQVARTRRFRDQQGRDVRELLPAKIERIDAKGNKYLDVVWDYLHEMSLDHALTAFSQRDENIIKQRRAATRDLRSALDNNPNLAGHDEQFQFVFMLEEAADIVTEAIEESPVEPIELPPSWKKSTDANPRKPR